MERIDVIVDLAPSRNICGQSRWHRNSHNDRVVWRDNVKRGLERSGLSPGDLVCLRHAAIDWGKAKPLLQEAHIRALGRELRASVSAYFHRGIQLELSATDEACGWIDMGTWSGRGQGTTRLTLDVIERVESRRGARV